METQPNPRPDLYGPVATLPFDYFCGCEDQWVEKRRAGICYCGACCRPIHESDLGVRPELSKEI